jgi:hypothetical protein
MATAQTHTATCERCHNFMKEQPVGLSPQGEDLSGLFFCVCTTCGHTEYRTRPFESFWRRLAAA